MAVIEGIGVAGWRGEGDRIVPIARPGGGARAGERGRGGEHLAAAFPGRWNPRRAIPPDTEPLGAAAALALEDAGWWRPGSGQTCEGALVVASDHGHVLPARRLAADLEPGPGAILSPSDFLFSLPSSAMAVLGMLFGFTEHQSTAAGGGPAGFVALRHALDLLLLGRVERVLLAAWSVAEGFILEEARAGGVPFTEPLRVAVAWCLGASSTAAGGGRFAARPEAVRGEDGALRLELRPPAPAPASARRGPAWEFQRLAALPFLAASEWLEYNSRPMTPTDHAP